MLGAADVDGNMTEDELAPYDCVANSSDLCAYQLSIVEFIYLSRQVQTEFVGCGSRWHNYDGPCCVRREAGE